MRIRSSARTGIVASIALLLAFSAAFAALAVWTLGLFGVLAAVTLSAVAPHERGYALTALALSPACLINAIGGQNGFLSAALLLGGTLLIDRRPILAGVLFGLLTFKPHLGLVLAFAFVVQPVQPRPDLAEITLTLAAF